MMTLKKDDYVLDVGCGIGGSAFLMAQVGTTTALLYLKKIYIINLFTMLPI